MNCLNNDYYFKRENKTIYQQFMIIEKQTGFLQQSTMKLLLSLKNYFIVV